MTDMLEVQAPAPMHQFRGESRMAEANRRLEEAARYDKILSSADLRKARAQLAALQKHLATVQADELMAERLRLLQDAEDAAGQLDELRAAYIASEDEADKKRYREQGKEIKTILARFAEERRAINRAIAPYRRAIHMRDAIKARINEHVTQLQDRAQAESDAKELEMEAALHAQLIIKTWVRLGYCYRRTVGNKTQLDTVKFERVICTADEIQYKIYISRLGLFDKIVHGLPQGVKAFDLVKPETIRELESATERQITSPNIDDEISWEKGVWLRQYRLNFTDGIMDSVDWAHTMARYPVDKQAQFPVPMGVKAGREINWIYLSQHPHMLVAGQTGSGKTNAIRVIISTLIDRHSPDEVRIILIDLKRGGDLRPYESAPHTYGRVQTELEIVARTMDQAVSLMRQRMDLIAPLGNDISDYNAQVSPERRMPRVIIVFDEYTAIHQDKDLAYQIQRAGVILATQSRAAGIHMILGAQQAYSDAIHKQIKANITLVLSGRQRTQGASMTTTGSSSSNRLKKIPGRMDCDAGFGIYQVQIPYISREAMYEGLAKASKWDTGILFCLPGDADFAESAQEQPLPEPFGENMVIRIALEQFEGALKADPIWKAIGRHDVSRSAVRTTIQSIVKRDIIELPNGYTYRIRKRPGNYYQLMISSPLDTARDSENVQYDGDLVTN